MAKKEIRRKQGGTINWPLLYEDHTGKRNKKGATPMAVSHYKLADKPHRSRRVGTTRPSILLSKAIHKLAVLVRSVK